MVVAFALRGKALEWWVSCKENNQVATWWSLDLSTRLRE